MGEPVETLHPEYAEHVDHWQLVRDALAGSRKIKEELPDVSATAVKTVYLPRLENQTVTQYRAYQLRALWVNFTLRALTAWTGLLFRKPLQLTAGAAEKQVLERDADMQGRSLQQYAEYVGGEVMSVGRGGTLIGYSEEEARPYLAYYAAENVINWSTGRVNGRQQLTLLVLAEFIQDPGANEFEHETRRAFRVFERLPSGVVTVTTYHEVDEGKIVVVDVTIPERRGIPLVDIPFVFHGASTSSPSIGIIPLEGIAEINVSHYRTSADLEHGRHVCGIPTPCLAGFTEGNSTEVVLGPNSAFVSEDANAKAFYLEFSGQGLAELSKAIAEKETQAAALGARPITPEVGGAEATATVEMRATAESASLVDVAQQLDVQFTQVVRWFEWWTATTALPSPVIGEEQGTASRVVFSKDFVTTKLKAPELQSLTAALVANKISFNTYFHNLSEGEVYPDDWTLEQEQEAVEAAAAMSLEQSLTMMEATADAGAANDDPPPAKAPPADARAR